MTEIAPLSETAYLIAWGRAQNPRLSLDPYSSLWLPPTIETFAEGFLRDVCPEASHLWCLRSHHVVSKLKQFQAKHGAFELLNVGSGITAYPFVLGNDVTTHEFDQEAVMKHRESACRHPKLPHREIRFHRADLRSDEGFLKVKAVLDAASKRGRPAFVLFEGILPYLGHDAAMRLVRACADLPAGSEVIVHVFVDEYKTHPMLKKIGAFFSGALGLPALQLTFFMTAELGRIQGLKLNEHMDFNALNRTHSPEHAIDPSTLIDERFFSYVVPEA